MSLNHLIAGVDSSRSVGEPPVPVTGVLAIDASGHSPEAVTAVPRADARSRAQDRYEPDSPAAACRSFTHERRRADNPASGSTLRYPFAWASPAAQQLLRQIQRVAAVEATALLVGESGTGKSMLARMIHERSQRSQAPFIAVNCASLPRELMDAELFGHTRGAFTGALEDRPGKVEAANGGTLFLDEIADLPLELQPKLLTFLQDKSFYRIGSNQLRHVDVRVISATHSDPAVLVAAHKFRQDLFFRLSVLRIDVPPLRQRIDDIRPLSEQILQCLTRQYGLPPQTLSDSALQLLETYDWPGNFRELENVLESAVTFGRAAVISAADLPLRSAPVRLTPDTGTRVLPRWTLAELERHAIIEALRANKGNKAQTARDLGISLRSIYNKMQRHGIVLNRTLAE
jgi:transcriptional regulator with PAS, ATPase and Fis domain